jgi:hypothetical protein
MNRERVRRWREKHPWSAAQRSGTKEDATRTSWRGMIDRCRREGHIGWRHYGGRGITVCERWSGSFENFLADMGPRPGKGYSIHRVDNDRGYEPGNCVWATQKEQMAQFKVNHPHGMSPRQYQRRLAANKRYRQRHPEKFRAYKKARRERLKAEKNRRPPGVGEELVTDEELRSGAGVSQRTGSDTQESRGDAGRGLLPGPVQASWDGAGSVEPGTTQAGGERTDQERYALEWIKKKQAERAAARERRGVEVELIV